MKTLNTIIKDALLEIDFNTIVKNTLIEQIKKSTIDAIESQFHYRGTAREAIHEKIKKELEVDFSAIKLPAYRDFIVNAVNDALTTFTKEEHAKEIIKHINLQVIGESRDEIEFNIFWDELKCKMEGCADNNETYHILLTEREESYLRGMYYYNLIIFQGSDKKEILYFAFSDGEIYHSRKHSDFDLAPVYTWLKALQFRGTKIIGMGGCEDMEMTISKDHNEY